MQFTQQSKSQLAKLLASENITIEHKKVQTAMFNLKTRTLTCPIWKDMSGDLYDLLMGHEVGHALETPEQGWHNAVSSKDQKISKNFRAFLNVVEDARIEKKMKRKFPGLRQPMIRGYNELLEKDFFGVQNKDLNSLPFIDRLNLYTKGGIGLGIEFNTEEYSFVKEVELCETWDDVIAVTQAIFDYSKEEQQELSKNLEQVMSSHYDDFDDSYDDTDAFDDGDYDTSEESGDMQDQNDRGESDDDSYDENKIERYKDSVNSKGLNQEPVCITDDAYRSNEISLLDESSLPYEYLEVPKPVYRDILTDHTIVHNRMEQEWTRYYLGDFIIRKNKAYENFKQKNDRYVSLLAKEFEMRKAASKFAKAKISESGDIDVSRIYKYKTDDDIFRKISIVPKGKSHGLVLIFDRSGSMSANMSPTLEQIMVLVSFCRKVNIPFVVYGFGNESDVFSDDHNRQSVSSFDYQENAIIGSDVYLREYLNSNMKTSVFTNAMKNLSLLSLAYDRSGGRTIIPSCECLSNTPLIEALFALAPLTIEFRKKHNLDIVNTILLHDGDADHPTGKMTSNGRSYISWKGIVPVLRDRKNKLEIPINNKDHREVQSSFLDWYRKATNSKLIGFFLTESGRSAKYAIRSRYVDSNGKKIQNGNRYSYATPEEGIRAQNIADEITEEVFKRMKKDGFVESNNFGYNKFFIIPGGSDLSVENEGIQIEGKITASKLKNAFIKSNKKKQISRVLVNRFISEIAV